ncbi:MAG: hypothetical protein KF891_01990 [Rhizobacter sp.]|nr:hypothetical protein [Rhizobacter sp.]
MRLPRALGLACTTGLGLGLAACAAAGPPATPGDAKALDFQVVHASATCGTEATSVRRIAGPGRLKHMLAGAAASAPPAEPDFTRALVLRVSMGQQASVGARFEVVSVQAAGDRLVIGMQWAPPDPQRMNAAVITRPCVIVSLPAGPYRTVQVVDTQGRERASASLPAVR